LSQEDERKEGKMTALTIVVPLLLGKQEAWRQFCQILQGSRRGDYAAWRERMGISQEEAWLSPTAQGDLVRVHLQVEHPEQVMADLATSPRPFDRWLRQHLLNLHGLDLAHLAPASAHELIFAWQPTPDRPVIYQAKFTVSQKTCHATKRFQRIGFLI
jgi:hypothetical protein